MQEVAMKENTKSHIWSFFGAVYAVTALLYAPILISGHGMATLVNKLLMVAVTFVPSLLGILFVHLTYDPAQRREFWKRVFRWPSVSPGVAIMTLCGFPALTVVAFVVTSYIASIQVNLSYLKTILTQIPLLVQFLLVEFFLGAVSEELGWRGYVLDQLQKHYSALASSLILGILWAVWHSPAFLTPGLSQYEMGGLFSWQYFSMMIAVTAGSVLHTWSYNNSGRSILLSGILMHFVQNAVTIGMGGIFDSFEMPPLFWTMSAVCTIMMAACLVWCYSPKTLATPQFPRSSRLRQDAAHYLLSSFRGK
jgi:membrane protease YdiL (CAAX protease family)